MTEYVKQPAFLDQIRVGDRFSTHGKEPITATGLRVDERDGRAIYTIIGIDDTGEPAFEQGVGSRPVIRYVNVPSEQDQ